MQAAAADVTLAWDPSASQNITGYKIYIGSSSRVYGNPVSIGNQTTYTVSGLSSGTHFFAVTAFDADGNESDFSNEVSKTDIVDETPPVIDLLSISISNITNTSVIISWTTNEASDTQVEYGTTTSYGSSTTLNGTLATSHAQALTGLTASTLYHYRVKSKDATGNASTSADQTFTTSAPSDITPPTISGISSGSITGTGATISWTTNEAADTQVEYGTTTSYGSSTTLNSTMVTSHAQTLTGLTAGTLYHYRVKSKDATGNLAISPLDQTFTTSAPSDITPPTISGIISGSITGTGATISWTTSEAADTQVEYGTTTSYGSSTTLNSTMATSHTQTLTGLSSGTLYHYRVKSKDAANNLATSTDQTFTTRDIVPPTISGISSGSITGTGATISWTTSEAADTQVEYGTTTSYGASTTLNSTMATSHTQALTGLTSGTLYHYRVKSKDAANNLATSTDQTFTTQDIIAPTISGIISGSITGTGATISWTTSEAADTQVEYGTTTSYGSSTTLNSTLATSHAQALTGLTSGTLYHYRVKSKDAANNLATSTDQTFTTQDIIAPTISGISSGSITGTGATISWTTNEAADTQVEYGTTTSYGSSTTLNSTLATSHTQALTGLTSGTLYHYRVKSKDAANNLATSTDQTFTTQDIIAPTISGIISGSITGTGATISWTTNEAADTQVEYGTTTSYGASTTLDSTLATSHTKTLTGLTSSTLYHYRVKSKDAANNLATSTDQTFTTTSTPDIVPPVIGSIISGSITETGATISWTTNEAADTQVEYGTTTSYGASTTLNSTLATSHTQALTGLTSGTLYHYRVKSKDAANNLATSTDQTFTTRDIVPPTISGISSGSITGAGATISWTTNEAADTQVEYGTTDKLWRQHNARQHAGDITYEDVDGSNLQHAVSLSREIKGRGQ